MPRIYLLPLMALVLVIGGFGLRQREIRQNQSRAVVLRQALDAAYQQKLPLLPDTERRQTRPSDRPTQGRENSHEVADSENEQAASLTLADLIALVEADEGRDRPDFKKHALFRAAAKKTTPDQVLQLIAEF